MSALVIGLLTALLTVGMGFIASSSMRRIAFSAVVMFFIAWPIAYLSMPTLNFWFSDLFIFTFVMMVFSTFLLSVGRGNRDENWFRLAYLTAAVAVVFVLVSAVSWPLFRAADYRALLGTVETRELATDLAPVDVNNIRQVPSEAAGVKVARIMGSDPGLGSRVNVGEKFAFVLNGCFTAQLLGGKIEELCFTKELVEMAPLEHTGLLTWFNNGVTPGYTLASTVNPDKFYIITGLVTTTNAAAAPATSDKMGTTQAAAGEAGQVQPIRLRYLSSAFFGDNLTRRIYQNGYAAQGFTEMSFELDDHGKPYVVTTLYGKNVGFGGSDATGALILDPQTGTMQEYSLNDLPDWVERVHPPKFIIAQLDNWGTYVNGYWNTWFSQLGVQTTTTGHALVEGADGNLYIYTGMTSRGSDKGTSGFVLVNTRSKEARFYSVAGATELAAAESARSADKVRAQNYWSVFPVMYNVDGIPTYFTVLMDGGSLVRAFAFVNVEQHDIVGTGSTWQDALRDYRRMLAARNIAVDHSDVVATETFSAKVLDVAVEVTGGVQTYYFLLEGRDGKEFAVPVDLSRQLKWTRTGDTVEVKVDIGENTTVPITSFRNTSKPQLP